MLKDDYYAICRLIKQICFELDNVPLLIKVKIQVAENWKEILKTKVGQKSPFTKKSTPNLVEPAWWNDNDELFV